jgi:hypothetical protein
MESAGDGAVFTRLVSILSAETDFAMYWTAMGIRRD